MLDRVARLVSVNVGRPQQISVRRGRPLMSAIEGQLQAMLGIASGTTTS